MKIKEGYILREVAESYVVVPIGEATLDFNGMMTLNGTGAFLFERMIKGTTKEKLMQDLITIYKIDKETAKTDVVDFIKKVKEADLFE